MTQLRYQIILRTYHTRTTGKGTKWETKKRIARNNKKGEVMLNSEVVGKYFLKHTSFRMSCLGFKLVRIIGMTTGANDHGQHELTVIEVKEE